MNETNPLVLFPVPSTITLIWLGLAFTLLIFGAVGYEVFRRMRALELRRLAQWRSIDEILEERRISPEAKTLLERVVKKRAYLRPLRVVTTRDGFEACVEAEMASLKPKEYTSTFENMGLRLRDLRTELGLDYIPIGQKIHSTRELHEGQWLSICLVKDKKPVWTRVMVEEVNEAYFYVVLKDSPASEAPSIRAGDPIRCRMWREEDARYLFETRVAAYEEPPATWRLEHVKEPERTQAREHFRIRHDQPVTIGILNATLESDKADVRSRPIVTRLRGRITSLSAGGCALVLQQAVSRQVLLRIGLDLVGGNLLECEAEIVSTATISGGRYLVRVKFLEAAEEEREVIAKYVLKKQQALLTQKSESR